MIAESPTRFASSVKRVDDESSVSVVAVAVSGVLRVWPETAGLGREMACAGLECGAMRCCLQPKSGAGWSGLLRLQTD